MATSRHTQTLPGHRNIRGYSSSIIPKRFESQYSMDNLATLESTTTSEGLIYHPEASIANQRIIEDMIDEIFAERRGQFLESSSTCELEKLCESEPRVDRRLRYWREVLAKRKKVQCKIEYSTGKYAEEVLFNRRSSLEDRNKETVKRILDYAERMRPEKVQGKQITILPEFEDPCTGTHIQELEETLPLPERMGYANVEVVGLSNVTKHEILGRDGARYGLRNTWQQSKVLDQHIEQYFNDITNVVEFFPDLDNLYVEGTNIDKLRPKPNIHLIGKTQLATISSTTLEPYSEECAYESCQDNGEAVSEPTVAVVPEVGMNVNGTDYVLGDVNLRECVEIITKFKCDPFVRRVKQVVKIINIGKQTLSFSWKQGTYFYNRASLLVPEDNEFVFDSENFRLVPGESYNLIVMYQPRKVCIAVELWMLQVEPKVFCCSKESLVLRFYGKCTPPEDYISKLKELHQTVMWKSSLDEVQTITTNLASIVPLIVPPEVNCPYDRTLDERELFNLLNPGYNCRRFDDLETLKAMHKMLKKPRERQWDLRLDAIKALIFRIEPQEKRAVIFSTYTGILSTLLGSAPSLERICQKNAQKQQTRFIYVRGVICSGIEEWEELMFTVEETFFKPELQRYYIRLLQEEEEAEAERINQEATGYDKSTLRTMFSRPEEDTDAGILYDETAAEEVLKKLRHSKYFRDSLYMQTYTHLCNIVEIMVSVIESTEIVAT